MEYMIWHAEENQAQEVGDKDEPVQVFGDDSEEVKVGSLRTGRQIAKMTQSGELKEE